MQTLPGAVISRSWLKKIVSGIAAIKRVRQFVPPATLHLIYKALIQPYFDYCNREFTQRRWRWQRNRHLKVNLRCLKLYRAYSISFNSSSVGKLFWSWILKDCIKVQEKKKKVVVFCSRPQQNVKLGSFTLIVVVQRRQRNVQKGVMHVQSCWFACLNLLLFCRCRCLLRRRCVKSLILFREAVA